MSDFTPKTQQNPMRKPPTQEAELTPEVTSGNHSHQDILMKAAMGQSIDPQSLTSEHIIHLQRTIGNQALQRMLQTPSNHAHNPQAVNHPPTTEHTTASEQTQDGEQQEAVAEDILLQRAWDWENAALGGAAGAIGGAAIGGMIGGVVGAGIGAFAGGLIGGLIGGLTAKATVDPTQTLREVAESLVETGGTGDASDKEVVVKELLKIPLVALSELKAKGTKVVVCRNSVTEIRTDLQGVQPRGWPAGKTWDSVPGLFDQSNNRVIIATRNGQVPATGDGHGAHNLVLHEVGHAIGHNVTTGGETDPRFIAARELDKAQLDNYEGQAGSAGVEETYAESFARFYDGDPNDARLYPNLHAYWASNPFVASN